MSWASSGWQGRRCRGACAETHASVSGWRDGRKMLLLPYTSHTWQTRSCTLHFFKKIFKKGRLLKRCILRIFKSCGYLNFLIYNNKILKKKPPRSGGAFLKGVYFRQKAISLGLSIAFSYEPFSSDAQTILRCFSNDSRRFLLWLSNDVSRES